MFLPTTPTYSTKQFSWSKACRTFCAEASDLAWAGGTPTAILLVSHKTGNVAAYSCARTDVDPIEHEVLAWVYVPSDPALAQFPDLAETSVIIFND